MKTIKNFLRTFILMGYSLCIYGQPDCNNALMEADKLYEAGNLEMSIARLEPCLNKRMNKEERFEACHLLAQAYFNLNNTKMAENYISKMLSLNHDYQKFPNIDPISFSRLINEYVVLPKFYIGLKSGINLNFASLKKSYSAYSSAQYYQPSSGFQFGLTSEYRLTHGIGIMGDFCYSGAGINHVLTNAGGWKQDYQEQQRYLMFILALTEKINLGDKLHLYGGIGFSVARLNTANVFFESTNNLTGTKQQITQNPVESRNRIQESVNALAGLGFNLSQGLVCFETSFAWFLGNTVNNEKRYSDKDFIFSNQYLNDDISLRQLVFSVSYKYPILWKVKKIQSTVN